MLALPNADTRRGGDNPSCAGLTSCTSPEVQSHQTENSHTGASSDCVPKGKNQRFVLRATYGRTEKAPEHYNRKSLRHIYQCIMSSKRQMGSVSSCMSLCFPLLFLH